MMAEIPGALSLIVERIEEGIAVLEGEAGSVEVPAAWLPRGAREGSMLLAELNRDDDASRLVLTLDREGQAAREAEIRRLRESIPEGPGGDVTL
jgi:hypothetical protein